MEEAENARASLALGSDHHDGRPRWGRYGLSAFSVHDDRDVDDLAATQLQRFPRLGLLRVADLLGVGFEVVPTFPTPHVTVAFTPRVCGLAAAGRVQSTRLSATK